MEHLIIPEDYFSPLSLYDTQVAIKTVKDFFQSVLSSASKSRMNGRLKLFSLLQSGSATRSRNMALHTVKGFTPI